MKNEHSFTFDGNIIKLLVTKDDPPKKRDANACDILVHVKNNVEEINEDVLDKLDQATDLIKKKFSKDPDAELDTYKLRISKYDVYIRDESKDNLILGTVLYILDHISDGVDKLIDDNNDSEGEEEDEDFQEFLNEENNKGKPKEESFEINLPDEDSSIPKTIPKNESIEPPKPQEHKSRFNISSMNIDPEIKKEKNKDNEDPLDMVDMLLKNRD